MRVKDEEFYKTILSFLDTYLVKQRNFSENTRKSYKKALKLLLEFFKDTKGLNNYEIGFDDLTYQNISDYLIWLSSSRECSDQTVNQRLMAIRSFVKYAGILDPSRITRQIEVSNVPAKKIQQTVVGFLSESALEVLFQQPDIHKKTGYRDYCFMTLMYDVGARCQELLDLRVCDMKLEGKKSVIYLTGKGQKTRRLPISENVANNMKGYISRFHPSEIPDSTAFVFFTEWHGSRHQMSPDAVALFLKKYAASSHEINKDIPEKIHPHLLRHSRAMHLYRGGMPLPLLSEFLGHADVNTTRIYAWSDTEMKRDAIKKIKPESSSIAKPIWEDDEDMIRKLYGLD